MFPGDVKLQQQYFNPQDQRAAVQIMETLRGQ